MGRGHLSGEQFKFNCSHTSTHLKNRLLSTGASTAQWGHFYGTPPPTLWKTLTFLGPTRLLQRHPLFPLLITTLSSHTALTATQKSFQKPGAERAGGADGGLLASHGSVLRGEDRMAAPVPSILKPPMLPVQPHPCSCGPPGFPFDCSWSLAFVVFLLLWCAGLAAQVRRATYTASLGGPLFVPCPNS